MGARTLHLEGGNGKRGSVLNMQHVPDHGLSSGTVLGSTNRQLETGANKMILGLHHLDSGLNEGA